MDIPKKGVSMEEVIEYRAPQKARSGSEEEMGLLFFLFKYFAYMYLSGYSTNNSNSWQAQGKVWQNRVRRDTLR